MGFGTLLVFFGVAFFSSQLVVPLAHVLGGPAAAFAGAPGVLARENSMRNPQRTASTAAALMIGLALVTVVAMLAASIIASFFDAVNAIWQTDYAVTSQNNYSPIPVAVTDPLKKSPVTTAVVGVRAGEARFLDQTHNLDGRRPRCEQGLQPRLDGGLARPSWRISAPTARSPIRISRRATTSKWARRWTCSSRTATPGRSRSRGSSTRRTAARRSAC